MLQAPELHALLHSTALLMGVEIAPDLFLQPQLQEACPPPSLPIALLHVPHVSTSSLSKSSRDSGCVCALRLHSTQFVDIIKGGRLSNVRSLVLLNAPSAAQQLNACMRPLWPQNMCVIVVVLASFLGF
jgi:hypothetical protein